MTALSNPPCRLALRTSSQQCVPNTENGFMTTVDGISNSAIPDSSLHGSSLSITAGHFRCPGKCSANPEMPFNLHNALQYHRDRTACGFLLVS